MRLMARNGVILAGGLFALWVVLAHPVGGGGKFPSDTQTEIVRTKASWEEKNENRKLAKRYAWAAFGWRGGEWECLESLWTNESRFDHFAQNPTSSAFGIAQLLGERSRDPALQILRGLRYIDRRYGTPCKAYNSPSKINTTEEK
jgi:resuscitation-promoting factor RpfB